MRLSQSVDDMTDHYDMMVGEEIILNEFETGESDEESKVRIDADRLTQRGPGQRGSPGGRAGGNGHPIGQMI